MNTITHRRLSPALVVGTATAALLTTAAGPALAADSVAPTSTAQQAACLATTQQRAEDLISQRQETLAALASKVNSTSRLSATDRAELTATISDTESGLAGLGPTIAADTTCKQAHADAAKIFTDYRVYVIVVPRANLLMAADNGLAAVSRLKTAASKIQTAIAAADAHHRDTTAAQAALKDLQSRIADAQNQFDTAHADAAALTPSSWNTNHDVTATARGFARSGREDVTAGISDVRAAVADLTT